MQGGATLGNRANVTKRSPKRATAVSPEETEPRQNRCRQEIGYFAGSLTADVFLCARRPERFRQFLPLHIPYDGLIE